MKLNDKGELVHEGYTNSFKYKGRLFIIDEFDDFWLITESQFLIKERGNNLEDTIVAIKKSWDKVEDKYKGF